MGGVKYASGAGAVKAGEQGLVSAVIATFNVVDSDGDWTVPGAFPVGAEVPISAYQHTSWSGALPVGKGVIRADQTRAWVEAAFFMNTAAGRDTFEVVKELGPLGQWSYGYDVVDSDQEQRDGRIVRVLRSLVVHEVSPVLVGAGVGTATLDAKTAAAAEYLRYVQTGLAMQLRCEMSEIKETVVAR